MNGAIPTIRLRDRYVSRPRGEAWLLLGDSLAAGSAILLASGAAAAGVPLSDRLLVAIWAILPGALGRVLDPVLARPRGTMRNIAVAAAVGSTLLALVLIGLDILGGTASEGVSSAARPGWQLLIVLAWSAGFVSFIPRTYAVHDLLLVGLAMVSLALGRPGGAVLAPLCLLGLLLSGAMRHQLLDVFSDVRRPRVNVHNARILSLGLAAAGSILFLGAHAGAGGLLSRPREAPPVRVTATTSAAPSTVERRAEGESGGAEPALAAGADAGDPLASGSSGGGELAPDDSGSAERGDGAVETDPGNGARLGFSRSVRLGNLILPERDPRPVLTVREHDSRGFRTPEPSLSPAALWRVLTLATFDAGREAWQEEVLVAGTHPWPTGALVFDDEGRGPVGGGPDLILEITIVAGVLPSLPAPYFPLKLNPPRGGGSEYRLNVAGDILPVAGVPAGTRYALRIAPHPLRGGAWPAEPVSGAHSDPRYGEIPAADLLGFDLALHAAPIFAGALSIQERIARLREHFSRDFRYDIEVRFARRSGRLRDFCLVEKVGNCEYFATAAALLLRAGGVSTRVAAGFLGWEWSAEAGEYRVPSGNAHLWVEVYFPGAGWFPVDATAWVGAGEDSAGPPADPRADGGLAADPGEERADPFPAAADPPETPAEAAGAPVAGGDPAPRAGETEIAAAAADPRADAGGERAMEEPLESWVELLPPPDGSESADASSRDERSARDRSAPGGAERERPDERSATRGDLHGASRVLLIAISLAVGALLLAGYLRPERVEEDEEPEDPIRPSGGIPDPLAGLLALPLSADPSDPRGRIIGGYHRLQRDLAERRRHRRPPETPREHARRLGERDPASLEDFSVLHMAVYAALYSPGDVGEREVEEAERAAERLRERLG